MGENGGVTSGIILEKYGGFWVVIVGVGGGNAPAWIKGVITSFISLHGG